MSTATKQDESIVFTCDFSANPNAEGLPQGWALWYPTEQMKPEVVLDADVALNGGASLRVAGAGNPNAFGLLKRDIPGLETGQHYRFTAYFKPNGIPNVNNTVWPLVSWQNKALKKLLPVAVDPDGWVQAEITMQMPEDMQQPKFELFAGWIPNGTVHWGKVEAVELHDYVPPTRPVKVAVLDEKPPKGSSMMDNCRFYVAEIEKLCAAAQPDAICFPEHFNTTNVEPLENPFGAISMDSEYMQLLSETAKRCNVNLIGSVVEDENGVIFNAGIVIDRAGKLIGKYHKTHMPLTEVIRAGRSRGEDLEVIQTDFGKIGILICWDYQFPDPIRELALKGAEFIFVPIAGEGRMAMKDEQGRKVCEGQMCAGRAAAVDNGLVMVFSVTQSAGKSWSESMIIDPFGVIRDRSGLFEGRKHALVAEIDLAAEYTHSGTERFRDKYFTERRPELYKAMTDTTLRTWR